MAKTKRRIGKAKPSAEEAPEAAAAAASPPPASSSTPVAVKKKIKKKKKKSAEAAAAAATEAEAATEADAAAASPPPSNSTPSSAKKKIKKKKKKPEAKKEETEKIPKAETLGAAPVSDSAAVAADKKEEEKESSGFIFMCNSRTKPECYRHQVFGMPRMTVMVASIKPGTRLFLYDSDLKMLYGVYSATTRAGMNLVPQAFGGAFPAQVKFKVDKDCIPLHERSFSQAIWENYEGRKFKSELSSKQVQKLVSMFQPTSSAPQTVPLQLENRHPHAHLPPAADPYRPRGYLAPANMPPPKDQNSERGHLPPAHITPLEDPYSSAGHELPSHLPPANDKYRSVPPEDPHRPGGYLAPTHPDRLNSVRGHLAPAHIPSQENPYRSAGHVLPSHLPRVNDSYRSGGHLVHSQLTPEDPYRPGGYTAPANMPPPADPSNSRGHLAPAHTPPLEDPYRSAGHVLPSHLPRVNDSYRSGGHLVHSQLPPEDPYRPGGYPAPANMPPPEDPSNSRGHLAPAHIPPLEDPYRSAGRVLSSHLLPVNGPYRSGGHLVHPQLPPEDPYRHGYLNQAPIDSRYLSHAPPRTSDPYVPEYVRAAPTVPLGDLYYPAPSCDLYNQLKVALYQPERSAPSECLAYSAAPGRTRPDDPHQLAAVQEVQPRQRYRLSAYEDPRLNGESTQKQDPSNAAANVSVSSRYSFAGPAPAYR
ncbi:uncharacterized protein M6B38_302375 [Iris pallida]|uniref:DCD domain-containing protein n=1 Tax=Iris pallida TaxID=29817 RepID=A0AAX6HPF1_IRIPA|nr:uncharacterized protein M6B38_302375 [Iris pallida]